MTSSAPLAPPLEDSRPEAQVTAPRRHRGVILRDPADALARAIIAGLFLGLAYRVGLNVIETGRFSGLLLLTSELLVVVLTLVRRPASRLDRSLHVRLVAAISIVGPFLMRPDESAALLAESMALAISGAGLAVVIAGKVSLGRSFGLLPANRGVVCTGIYRFIRHPIYLGYFLTHGAFLFANATLWNIVALVTADIALLVRARMEERTLEADDAYRRYLQVVPWRLIPGLY
jgi:protein-S-isoprenylcysteine O-methyltransferase Ste14